MQRFALLLLAAATAACASHDGPFAPVGQPAMPLHQARPHCKAEHRTVSSDGTAEIDWAAYERCMADLGWVKVEPGSAAGAPATGGGGAPAY